MRELLKTIVHDSRDWTELRVHDRRSLEITVRKGILESAAFRRISGVGVRVLLQGTWGFSSTARLDRPGILAAVADARSAAESTAGGKAKRVERLAECELAVGDYRSGSREEITRHTTEEKTALTVDTERRVREASPSIRSASSRYTELLDEKWIVSTDGADAELPAGSIIYHVDRGDIFEVHRQIGHKFCLSGGVPNDLLAYGTPEEVRAFCKKVIDGVARDGGYIMDAGAIMQQDTRIENVRAMTDVTREYGEY